MLNAIAETLRIMGVLGIVLIILAAVNIITGTLFNMWEKGEKFSWKKMLQGIEKVLIFYASAIAIAVAFTMLPFINERIIYAFEVTLINADTLHTLSSTAVLGTVITAIIVQGKKAIAGIGKLANMSSEVQVLGEPEEIEVIEELEETE